MKIDNFALVMHQTCPTKYNYRMKHGWTVRHRSAALGFGGALHEGLACWYRGEGLNAALAKIETAWTHATGPDEYRTLEKCLDTMRQYVKEYPAETFSVLGYGTDSAMVERTFTIEMGLFLPCRDHWMETKRYDKAEEDVCFICRLPREPLQYGGIFDTLVEASGHIYVLEHKTTSMLGSFYFNQFKPNNQISGYVWAGGQMSGGRVAGAIVNAIGVYKVGKTRFERHITSRNQFELDEWKSNVWHEVCSVIEHDMNGYWPKRTQSCTMYGACEFHSVCSVNSPEHRNKRLEQDYVIDPWVFEERDG